jgi:hypothetical protein
MAWAYHVSCPHCHSTKHACLGWDPFADDSLCLACRHVFRWPPRSFFHPGETIEYRPIASLPWWRRLLLWLGR